jgi:DNA (cytosine-5)-methyltransferase 1
MTLKYLSVCSGIEAATVAWEPFGWKPVGFSEIDSFASQVLKYRYPNIINYGGMTNYEKWEIPTSTVDLLVGGTPCQSFSIAGLRKGLRDPRGGLMLTFLEIAQRFRPRWIVWENVPGVLTSSRGRDFGSFVGALGELGYGWAYRVLDAQWVRVDGFPNAVPQRRRRCFVVGYLGDWRSAAKVLFESESVSRNTPKSGASWKETARDAETSTRSSDNTRGCWWDGGQVSQTLDAVLSKGQTMPEKNRFPAVLQPIALQGNIIGRSEAGGPVGVGATDNGSMYTLTKEDVHGVIQPIPFRKSKRAQSNTDDETWVPANEANTLNAFDTGERDTHGVLSSSMRVRRLTPIEAERLQGFPDNYTRIPWRGKDEENCPDSPRYKAIGNSMAVNCMRWIGQRICKIDKKS